jgi:outer membrane biosynthesis protein TonB
MKASVRIVLVLMALTRGLIAQTTDAHVSHHAPYEIKISPAVAEKLLVHQENPDVCPHIAMAAHVTGTVVVSFLIDKDGNVRYPNVISGPHLLQKPILDAVRKYKYNPYILNGKAVEVETSAAVTIDNARDCHSK